MKNPILNAKLPEPLEVIEQQPKFLSRKDRKKQRAQEIKMRQQAAAMRRIHRIDQMMQNGDMSYFADVHQASHILMTALQMVFEELSDILDRNEIELKNFERRFSAVNKANDEMYDLMARISDDDATRSWSINMDKFMHIFSNFIGFNPFGIDLQNIKLTKETVMTQYLSITYNKLRIRNSQRTFTLTNLKEQADTMEAPLFAKIIKELRAHNFIIKDGRQFCFTDKAIPMDFFEKFTVKKG